MSCYYPSSTPDFGSSQCCCSRVKYEKIDTWWTIFFALFEWSGKTVINSIINFSVSCFSSSAHYFFSIWTQLDSIIRDRRARRVQATLWQCVFLSSHITRARDTCWGTFDENYLIFGCPFSLLCKYFVCIFLHQKLRSSMNIEFVRSRKVTFSVRLSSYASSQKKRKKVVKFQPIDESVLTQNIITITPTGAMRARLIS